jgi:hypothetical protein
MQGRAHLIKSIALGAILVLFTSTATAGISNVVFTIEATNASAGTGSLEFEFADGTYDPVAGTFIWNQLTMLPILNDQGTAQVATLQQATLFLDEDDPQINLGFAVFAGDADTTFTITSALVSFNTIPDALSEGLASAAFGLTDQDGSGATLASNSGLNMYRAYYNGLAPNGTLFTDLVDGAAAAAWSSGGNSANDPASGYRDVAGDVSDMSVELGFSLTANDWANGTTNFEIIPEPTTVAGLALLALVALRRNR